eukprot:12296269-Ditylum_brightwellii.AAC.1
MELEAAGSHPGISIWSKVYCLGEDGRGNHHTPISHEVNGDHDHGGNWNENNMALTHHLVRKHVMQGMDEIRKNKVQRIALL